MSLSDRARSICAAHWNPPRTRCMGCPIRSECEAPLPRPYGMGDVNKHTEAVNAAADRHGKV